jgi:HD-like signal output (HDOD) protein
MFMVLRRWWLGAARRVDDPLDLPRGRQGAQGRKAAAQGPAGEAPQASADMVHEFTAALLGVKALHAGAPTAAERALLDRLASLADAALADEPLVPRLPSVLPRLMRLVRRDDTAARELADLLGREPALLGEVMRLANAAARCGPRTLTSLDAAVAMLGQRGIQQVVSRAAMAPVFELARGRLGAAAGPLLWNQAQRSAHACAMPASGAPDRFEAQMAGMVARTGLIVALRLLDQGPPSAPPASLAFHQRLAPLTARLSARIAGHWRLPPTVVQAVASLVDPAGEAPATGLAAALRRADRCSMRHVLAHALDALPAVDAWCHDELDRVFGRPPHRSCPARPAGSLSAPPSPARWPSGSARPAA